MTEQEQTSNKDAQMQFPFTGKVAAIDQPNRVALVLDLNSMAAFSLSAHSITVEQWEQLRVGQRLRFTDDGYGEIKDLEFIDPMGVA